MPDPSLPSPFVSLNPEFLFYLLYRLLTGQLFGVGTGGEPNVTGPSEWVVYAQIWWERFTIVSFVITGVLLFVMVQLMVRYYRLLRYQDEVLFAPLPPRSEEAASQPRAAGEGARNGQPAASSVSSAEVGEEKRYQAGAQAAVWGHWREVLAEAEQRVAQDYPPAWREAVLKVDDFLRRFAAQHPSVLSHWEKQPALREAILRFRQVAEALRSRSSDYVLTRQEAVRALEAIRLVLAHLPDDE